MTYDPASLLGRLHTLPDPRRGYPLGEGRRYPLAAVLGLLMLAALHGETSLRGMWLWSRQHWHDLWWPLGFTQRVPDPHFPALTTIWNLLGTLDADAVDHIVSAWLCDLLTGRRRACRWQGAARESAGQRARCLARSVGPPRPRQRRASTASEAGQS